MTTPLPTPEPPYEGIPIPGAFREVPYDKLPNGIQRRVDDWIAAHPVS